MKRVTGSQAPAIIGESTMKWGQECLEPVKKTLGHYHRVPEAYWRIISAEDEGIEHKGKRKETQNKEAADSKSNRAKKEIHIHDKRGEYKE